MKLVEAIVKPHKFDAVKEALVELGVQGMTVMEVKGFGRQKGHKEVYRSLEYTADLLPKVMIKLFVKDDMVSRVIDTIAGAAKTGTVGDGKIFVMDLGQVVRIRTGETGESAL